MIDVEHLIKIIVQQLVAFGTFLKYTTAGELYYNFNDYQLLTQNSEQSHEGFAFLFSSFLVAVLLYFLSIDKLLN